MWVMIRFEFMQLCRVPCCLGCDSHAARRRAARPQRTIFLGVDARLRKNTRTRATSKQNGASRFTSEDGPQAACTGVRIRCREGHAPLTTLSRRVIAAHSRLPQAHGHRNQAADQAAASCEMASCHTTSSHSMHEVPSPHASAPMGTPHEHLSLIHI